MQSSKPKQYLPLAGRTVIEHALIPFLRNPRIDGLVVAVPAGDQDWARLRPDCEKPLLTVTGGATRAHSVLAALECLSGTLDDATWVLVHDAVRPCLADADLTRLITVLDDDRVGGLLAVRAQDTLKWACDDHVEHTIDRSRVWQAQTPQMFRLGALAGALRAAIAAGQEVTDEASVMEWQGMAPRLVEGRSDNIKITRPADLALAENILSRR